MSEWPVVALGTVTSQSREAVKVDRTQTYPMLGVRWYAQGAFHRETVTPKAGTIYRVRPGQFIYNRLFAWKGSFGLVTEDLAGSFVSNEFPLFGCDPERLLPEYLSYSFGRPQIWSRIERVSTGTTASRNRWNESAFNAYEVALPPLQEQRRIVTVMAAIDVQIEAMEAEVERAKAARGPLAVEMLSSARTDGVLTPLGAVGTFIRGRRFTKEEYVESGLGCIHYGQVHTHFGSIAKKAITFVNEAKRERLRLAEPGDVVVAATSEDMAALGKATVWLGDDEVAVHDDCYIFRHALEPRFASYVFASPEFQQDKVQYASGTKVTRISGENLGRVKVTIPTLETQAEIGNALSVVDEHIASMSAELGALRTVRADLLTALLSQEITVDAAVDKFVKVA